jgi:hypothetical protein
MRPRLGMLLFLTLLVSVGVQAQNDPLIGTWKLNLTKSKYSLGPPPKSQIIKYEPYGGDGLKITTDGVDAQGNSTHTETSAKFDGKDYPLTGSPIADTISMKRIDANTTERTYKKAGKVTSTSRRVVSRDGKTLTLTNKGTDAQGKPTSSVAVYDKQ